MTRKERSFVDAVWRFYKEHGRHALPWRKTRNPYRILVSEVMLQQTQVDRVLPKYKAFLKQFPTTKRLAQAPLSQVLLAWQGLGYNRRAKMLHQCAQIVQVQHKGTFPKTYDALIALPGIGPYTAGAVCAFAYNTPVSLIETNVRTVFIHHFFHDYTDVSDSDILRLIEVTVPLDRPREWYWALMDYGAYLKKTVGNKNTQSRHYTKQTKFTGSDRQIRGAIVRLLSDQKVHSRKNLHKALSPFEDIRIDAQLTRLIEEEMVCTEGTGFTLPH